MTSCIEILASRQEPRPEDPPAAASTGFPARGRALELNALMMMTVVRRVQGKRIMNGRATQPERLRFAGERCHPRPGDEPEDPGWRGQRAHLCAGAEGLRTKAQLQKFMNYYLPTALKLLNTYASSSGRRWRARTLPRPSTASSAAWTCW